MKPLWDDACHITTPARPNQNLNLPISPSGGLHMWGYTCGLDGLPICGVVVVGASPYPHAWACGPPQLWASPLGYLWAPPCPHTPICGLGGFSTMIYARVSARSHFLLVGLWVSPPVGLPIWGLVGAPITPSVYLWLPPPVGMGTSP